MVRVAGFEPAAYRLGGGRSIQLSYTRESSTRVSLAEGYVLRPPALPRRDLLCSRCLCHGAVTASGFVELDHRFAEVSLARAEVCVGRADARMVEWFVHVVQRCRRDDSGGAAASNVGSSSGANRCPPLDLLTL